MDGPDRLSYHGRHETSWQPQSAGAASPTGHPAAKEGPHHVGGGGAVGLLPQFGRALGPSLRAGRTQGSGAQANAWPTPQVGPTPETAPGTPALARPPNGRLPHRPLDHPAGCRRDPAALGGVLSSQLHLGAAAGTRLELPEAGTTGAPAQQPAIAHWKRYVWPHIKKG